MKSLDLAIVGVGETAFVRKSERSMQELVVEATRKALADAGLGVDDIDGLVGVGQITMDEVVFALGMKERPFTAQCDMVAGAATVGGAIELARMAIETGVATTVLVPFVYASSQPGGPYAFHARDPLKAGLELPVGYHGQPIFFAATTQRYIHEYGLTVEELGSISCSMRSWGAINPNAQKQQAMEFEQYLESPMIATPLRVADCCLMTDGACSYIVTTRERARDLKARAVAVAGYGIGTNRWPQSMTLSQTENLFDLKADISSQKAYAMAGIKAADADLVQVYDCFSINVIFQMEQMGFAEEGAGARPFFEGLTRRGGKLPVNTSGGHMSAGYMPGASLMIEAVRQLRGERGVAQVPDAEIAVVGGIGGNAHSTSVLTRM